MMKEESTNKVNVLFCFSGSVATLKVPEIYNRLLPFANVRLISSGTSADYFLQRSSSYQPIEWGTFKNHGGPNQILRDVDEWSNWDSLGDHVVHIELRKWADILLLAPASANTIAKASIGLADSLMLSVFKAWDFQKPCILCPAMNSVMWDHPSTLTALTTLQEWGWIVIQPTVKTLACNEKGNGALALVDDIIDAVQGAVSIIPVEVRGKSFPKINIQGDVIGPNTNRYLCRETDSNDIRNYHMITSSSFSLVAMMAFWIIATNIPR